MNPYLPPPGPPPGVGGGSSSGGWPSSSAQPPLPPGPATYALPPGQGQALPPQAGLPYATYAEPPSRQQQQAWDAADKPAPPQIWGQQQHHQPLPQAYPSAFHHPGMQAPPMFMAPGGGFVTGYPQNGQVIIMGAGGMVPLPLEDGIPQQFSSMGTTTGIIVTIFSLISVALAATSIFTPWVLVPIPGFIPPVPIPTCSLAFGLSNFGVLGSGCSSISTPIPNWPTPYTRATGSAIVSGSQGGVWVESWLAITVVFFALAAASAGTLAHRFRGATAAASDGSAPRSCHFATAVVSTALAATGFAAAWIGGAWGTTFFNNLRQSFPGTWATGAGQVTSQVLFGATIVAMIMSSVLRCRIRQFATSRTMATRLHLESLLGQSLDRGDCC